MLGVQILIVSTHPSPFTAELQRVAFNQLQSRSYRAAPDLILRQCARQRMMLLLATHSSSVSARRSDELRSELDSHLLTSNPVMRHTCLRMVVPITI
jgi:hypothetical protein